MSYRIYVDLLSGMKPNRKILIVSYYWPPSGGAGVQRWLNLAIHLKKEGWEPIVLTPKNPQFEIKDDKLPERVADIETYRIPMWEPFDLFQKLLGNDDQKNGHYEVALEKPEKSLKDEFMVWILGNLLVPDPGIFWVRPAAKKATELIQDLAIGTIITTGPPHSIHLIGRKVKRATGVNWVADFRAPWSKWDVLKKRNTSALVMNVHKRLEQRVLNESDVSITVSKRLSEAFGGIKLLPNGLATPNTSSVVPNEAHFTIGYFGLLNELRNPRQSWHLLDQMCRENQVFANKLRVRIGGMVSESVRKEIEGLKELKRKVEFLGYLPHERMQSEYQKCNVLLLLLNKSDNAKWILPTKFFEYVTSDRLILGLGDRKGDLGDLMNDKNIGEILGYSEIDSIRGFIEDIFEKDLLPTKEDVETLLYQFSYSNLAKKIEDLLQKKI